MRIEGREPTDERAHLTASGTAVVCQAFVARLGRAAWMARPACNAAIDARVTFRDGLLHRLLRKEARRGDGPGVGPWRDRASGGSRVPAWDGATGRGREAALTALGARLGGRIENAEDAERLGLAYAVVEPDECLVAHRFPGERTRAY